jgi:Flp pilus assembly protein TadG
MNMAYIWGYDTTVAIATVKNAALNEVAHTSFEPDASGYWSIPSTVRDITQGITGKQSYALSNGSITKSALTTSKGYIVSYWSKGASATVNGATATSGYNKNGWSYYEHKLNAGPSTVTVSGTVTIDELRLYPVDAQMTTTTYDPLTGVTSSCDLNNRIRYYEFDGFNSLKLIRDEDRNVIKSFDYRIKL